MSSLLKQLPVAQLVRGPYQPRRQFTEAALQELAESIQQAGIIQPIVVRPRGTKGYEILAGERRWRAAQLVGLVEVPCLVREITDSQAAQVTTIENIQRQDLNPIEEAQAYQRLIDEFGYSHEEIALLVSKSRAKITNVLRLLRLSSDVKELLMQRQLSEGHAKLLINLPQRQQVSLAQACVAKQWSVRQLQQSIDQQTKQIKPVSTQDPNIQRLQNQLSDKLGTPVSLEPTEGDHKGGWLKIQYFNDDTLSGILQRIGISEDEL